MGCTSECLRHLSLSKEAKQLYPLIYSFKLHESDLSVSCMLQCMQHAPRNIPKLQLQTYPILTPRLDCSTAAGKIRAKISPNRLDRRRQYTKSPRTCRGRLAAAPGCPISQDRCIVSTCRERHAYYTLPFQAVSHYSGITQSQPFQCPYYRKVFT